MVRYCACIVHPLLAKTQDPYKAQRGGGEPVPILLRRWYSMACGQVSLISFDWDSQEAYKQGTLICHDVSRPYKLPVCWMRDMMEQCEYLMSHLETVHGLNL